MAGNHFKGSDSGRPAVPPRPNGAGKAGTPGGAGQGGSGKRVSPGETAMFTALYEQSQKAKKTGRARGNVFADGATSTSQPSGVPSVPANNAGAANAANAAGNVNAGKAANNTPSAGGAGLTGNLGTIYTGASETGTFARLDDSGAEFAGSGSKEDYYDFGLNYGSDASSSSTSDGLVRHRHRKGERKKRHTGAIIAAVAAVLLVALGASGFMLLSSAKTVKSQAKETVEIVGGLKDKVTSGDFSTLPDDAKKIDELCSSMKKETSSRCGRWPRSFRCTAATLMPPAPWSTLCPMFRAARWSPWPIISLRQRPASCSRTGQSTCPRCRRSPIRSPIARRRSRAPTRRSRALAILIFPR